MHRALHRIRRDVLLFSRLVEARTYLLGDTQPDGRVYEWVLMQVLGLIGELPIRRARLEVHGVLSLTKPGGSIFLWLCSQKVTILGIKTYFRLILFTKGAIILHSESKS